MTAAQSCESTVEPTVEPTVPLVGTVVDALGADIVTGSIAAPARFTLSDLSARFGISRTVAREAMRSLEQMGLVASSRRIGITVLPQCEWNLFDPQVIRWRLECPHARTSQQRSFQQLRLAIEPLAARLSAEHATLEQRTGLRRLAARMEGPQPLTPAGAHRTYLHFHAQVLQSSSNEMFGALATPLLALRPSPAHPGGATSHAAASAAAATVTAVAAGQHTQLAEAIAHSLADAAEATARDILAAENGDGRCGL